MVAPIRKCRNLTAVTHLIGKQPRFRRAMRALRATPEKEQFLVLAAPATAALAIDASSIAWPTDRALRLLLVNTKPIDVLDSAQWFRYVPAMLGHHHRISVTVCGLDEDAAQFSTVSHLLQPHFNVECCWDTPLHPLSSVSRQKGFDIAIALSGPPSHSAMANDLDALRRLKAPFFFTSYSSTHALLNHALLRAFGACAESTVACNPFALVSQRSGENLYRVLSCVPANAFPAPGTRVDSDFMNLLGVTSQVVLNSHRCGDPSQSWPVGATIDGSRVHTFDGVLVDVQTGDIIDANDDSILGRFDSRQQLESVRIYDPNWDETDKLVWAAHIRYYAMHDGLTGTIDRRAPVA